MASLCKLFDSIEPAPGEVGQYSARSVPDLSSYRIAKDSGENPALLIDIQDRSGGVFLPPVVLEHLRIQYELPCQVLDATGRIEEKVFTVIRCVGDRVLQQYFLSVMEPILTMLGDRPSRTSVSKSIDTLIELFLSLSKEPRTSLQGLWGELLVIVNSDKPESLAEAWHSSPTDRFDFSLGSNRLEVKSTGKGKRQHHFSLEQLSSPEDVNIVVASLFVEPSAGGSTVLEILEELRNRLVGNDELILHVDRVVASTLGASILQSEERFDRELAENSLRFFRATQIPQIRLNAIPNEVTDVRFQADLSHVSPMTAIELRGCGGFVESLCTLASHSEGESA